jgi:hypothetical protein
MSRQTRRFVPRLEAFDDRCLPSVNAVLSQGTLQITGDANANTIAITDDGTATGVTIVADGQPLSYTSDGSTIQAIIVDAGAGNDNVSYTLNAPGLLAFGRNIGVHLGTGNDTFTANLDNQGLAQYVSLALTAYGEGGADTLNLYARNFSTDANSILNFDFVGGAGKDKINYSYTPGALDLGSILLQKDQKH